MKKIQKSSKINILRQQFFGVSAQRKSGALKELDTQVGLFLALASQVQNRYNGLNFTS